MADDHQKNLQRFMAKQKQKKSISSSSATPVTPPPPPPPPHTASASASFLHGRDHQVVLVQNGDGANNNINVRIENNAVGRNNNYRAVGVFPPGYRFCPLDSELIIHYLMKKIKNEALPHDQIKDVNLYHFNPDHLSARYEPVGDREWYFFTPRDRKYRNGNRPNRAAGDGYWKATGADKAVRYGGKKVGFRKALVFYEGKPPVGAKTNWIMHEYRANGPERTRLNAQDMRLDDWVLCRLYHKEEKDSKSQARSVKEESAQRPRARVRSHDHHELFNTTQMMNNNEASSSEMGSVYNGVENLSDYHHHRLMMKNTYGEMHPTGFPHAFPPQAPPPPPPPPSLPPPPHPPFIDFANSSNGGFQQPLMYGSRPVNVSRPPYLSGGNVSRSHYHEEDQLWNLYRRGLIQEPMWDNRNHNHNNLQNFPGSSQFDISSINFMVEPPNWNYLDIDFGVINPSDDVNNYNTHPADVHPPNAVNDKPSSDETLDDIVIDYPPEDPPGSPPKPKE